MMPMGINVTLVPIWDMINEPGRKKKGFIPASCSKDTLNTMDILTEVENGNVSTAIRDKAVIDGFMYRVFEAIKDGHLVKVDGFGVFKPIVSFKKGTDRTAPKNCDIEYVRVEFIMTLSGREKLKDAKCVITKGL